MPRALRPLVITLILLAASLGASAQTAEPAPTGRRIDFTITPFQDTLFTAITGALRVRVDDDGHAWYTTEGGLVHVDPRNRTRELFTHVEGLPSSYTTGLSTAGQKVYVATDLGVGIVDRVTGAVSRIDDTNSPLPDTILYDVALVGDDLWIGTRFFGVAIWNTTKPLGDASAWIIKNTSTKAGYAEPVRRIVPTRDAVWLATEGNGAWRYDRASATWNVTVKEDGLPDNTVLSVAERGDEVWFGTARGLAVRNASGSFTLYNTSNGMPSARVLDIDILQTINGTTDVLASTTKGFWQLEPVSGRNATHTQQACILGSYIFDAMYDSNWGWWFATTRGVSRGDVLYREGCVTWDYYSTGPSSGASWGPLSFAFTAAGVGDQGGHLWFGAQTGLSAYRLPSGTKQGYWQNFGDWQNYPGGVVNWIDTEGNTTWFGSNTGAYGFDHETGRWIPKLANQGRNIVYGIEVDRNELWIPLFGDGLIMEDLTTGVTRSWDATTVVNPLPDLYLTEVRADEDTIWLGASIGVIQLDRLSGAVRATYTKADGVPGNGVVYRLLPDGPNVWVGTRSGGLAKLDVASGKVTRVWNATNDPGFPKGEIRSLLREGGRLWVGTNAGLVRVDVTTGSFRAWNQSNSDLVQDYVNGISLADGILYLATFSGVQRLDVATGEFYPMRDGPGVVRASSTASLGPSATRVSVRIDSPRDGSAAVGPTEVRGTALLFGGAVERVEYRIGEGEWQPAFGAEEWHFEWNASESPANVPVTIGVRASGAANATGESEIVLTPVAAPTVPLSIEEVPSGEAFADRTFRVAARAQGDEPLTANYFYRPAGASVYTKLPLTRQGGLFMGSVPAKDMREGEMRYYFEAESGLVVETAGGDASSPGVVTVAPAPRLAVAVEAPGLVVITAGHATPFSLNVTNIGTEPATFRIAASGLRASWVSFAADEVALGAGETKVAQATIAAPASAFADETTITFEARDATGIADPASASVPIRIVASDAPATTSPPTAPTDVIPLAPALALVAMLGVALALRRRQA